MTIARILSRFAISSFLLSSDHCTTIVKVDEAERGHGGDAAASFSSLVRAVRRVVVHLNQDIVSCTRSCSINFKFGGIQKEL